MNWFVELHPLWRVYIVSVPVVILFLPIFYHSAKKKAEKRKKVYSQAMTKFMKRDRYLMLLAIPLGPLSLLWWPLMELHERYVYDRYDRQFRLGKYKNKKK